MSTYGWLLVPVTLTDDDEPDDARLAALMENGAFDLDNPDAYSDVSENRQFAFVSTADAPTFKDALATLKPFEYDEDAEA